jgi:hypothetical protein
MNHVAQIHACTFPNEISTHVPPSVQTCLATMLFHGGTKHDDVINVTLGTMEVYKNLIHHSLEFCSYIFQPKR